MAPEVLNQGYEAYTHYCRACHGMDGDGKGPAAYSLRPPPRDFTQAQFKFAAVESGELPNDADLHRIVKNGLHGTAMLEWDVPKEDLEAIIQYIKTFAEDWVDYEPGEAVVPEEGDPWDSRREEAIARGKAVYHGLAQCQGCHPAYATHSEIAAATMAETGQETSVFAEDLYLPKLTDTAYGYRALAPDFVQSKVRSVREGYVLEDLWRIIASGVGGTAMPTWSGILEESDIWAMAYFVEALLEFQDDPEGRATFRQSLVEASADAQAEPAGTH